MCTVQIVRKCKKKKKITIIIKEGSVINIVVQNVVHDNQ